MKDRFLTILFAGLVSLVGWTAYSINEYSKKLACVSEQSNPLERSSGGKGVELKEEKINANKKGRGHIILSSKITKSDTN